MAELEVALTAQEFGEWQALYMIEPWGEYPTYLAAGIVASTVANVHRSPDQSAFSAAQFMPTFGEREEAEEISPEEFVRKNYGGR